MLGTCVLADTTHPLFQRLVLDWVEHGNGVLEQEKAAVGYNYDYP